MSGVLGFGDVLLYCVQVFALIFGLVLLCRLHNIINTKPDSNQVRQDVNEEHTRILGEVCAKGLPIIFNRICFTVVIFFFNFAMFTTQRLVNLSAEKSMFYTEPAISVVQLCLEIMMCLFVCY